MPTEKSPGAIDAEAVKEPSLKEIINDENLGRSFNVWLEGQKKEALGARLFSGELKGDDVATLKEERKQFLERQKESTEMKEVLLDKGRLAEFIAQSADLEGISDLVREEGVKEALETLFDEFALLPDKRHQVFYKKYVAWKKANELHDGAQKELSDYAEMSHLSVAEAGEVAAITDVAERKKKIEELWKNKDLQGTEQRKYFFGWVKRDEKAWTSEQKALMDKTTEEFSVGLKADGNPSVWQDTTDAINEALEEIRKKQEIVVQSLGSAVSRDGVKEIGRLIMSEEKPEDTIMNFHELKKEIEKEKDKEKYANDFFEYADGNFPDFMYESGMAMDTLDQKNDAVDSFYAGFKRERINAVKNNKGGIWAVVYEAMIEPFMDEVMAEWKENDLMAIDKNRDDDYLLTKKKKK